MINFKLRQAVLVAAQAAQKGSIIFIFGRRPGQFRDGAQPGEGHVFNLGRVGYVFGPELGLDAQHMSSFFDGNCR